MMLSNPLLRPLFAIGTFTLLLSIAFCVHILSIVPDGIMGFVMIGTLFSEDEQATTFGYDGQFSYAIAREGVAAVPRLDTPAYRYQRILYPMLSRALSFGNIDVLPWVMLGINIIAHTIGVIIFGYLLTRLGVSPFAALTYTIWVGNLYSLRLDLHEPLCLALALLGIMCYVHGRYRWTLFALMLSALTKDMGIVIAVAIALHAFFQGKRHWALLLFGGPLCLYGVWAFIIYLWTSQLSMSAIQNISFSFIPFQAIVAETEPLEMLFLVVWLVFPAVILFLLATYRVWKDRSITLGIALILFSAVFVSIMPGSSWEDPLAAFRIATPLVIAGVLFIAEHYQRFLIALVALWMFALLIPISTPWLWL